MGVRNSAMVTRTLQALLALELLLETHSSEAVTRDGVVIADEFVDLVVVVDKSCECRNKCFANDTCAGASVEPLSSKIACKITSVNLTLENQDQLTVNATAGKAFFKKRKPPCTSDERLVPGVGCVFISPGKAGYHSAKTSCPPSSPGLYAPKTTYAFLKLKKYLLENSADIGSGVWIGIEKSDSGHWRWRTGSYIGTEKPSYFWSRKDPDNGEPCARLANVPNVDVYFELADGPCGHEYKFICEV